MVDDYVRLEGALVVGGLGNEMGWAGLTPDRSFAVR